MKMKTKLSAYGEFPDPKSGRGSGLGSAPDTDNRVLLTMVLLANPGSTHAT